MSTPRTCTPHALALLGCLGALLATGCSNTMAFSDTATIAVVGHPPPPPEPPPTPAAEPKRVEVVQDQIVIREKIQFETDQAVIKPESFDLMNEITSVVSGNPQIKQLSVEGHTDNAGSDKHNQKLSDKRAAAVRGYLVEHGIAADRLVSKGWGEAKPIADNGTDAGREQNRRVEFVILAQDTVRRIETEPAPSDSDPAKPADAASAAPEGTP